MHHAQLHRRKTIVCTEGKRERESSVEVKGMGSVALSELSIIRDVPSIKHYVACFTLVLLCPFQFT